MPNLYNIGICLPGGGGAGVNQAAALCALSDVFAESGYIFENISAASVGTLNGILFCQNDLDKMKHLWCSISRKHVYDFSKILNPYSNSYLCNKPLHRLIRDNINLRKLSTSKSTLIINAVDSVTGDRVFGTSKDSDVIDGLLASTAIPAIFPPRMYKGKLCVDGGVYDNSPISPLIGKGCGTVIVIYPYPKNSVKKLNVNVNRKFQLFNALKLLYMSNQNKDIEQAKMYNSLLKNGDLHVGSKFNEINIIEWYPEKEVGILEFNSVKNKEVWDISYDSAVSYFLSIYMNLLSSIGEDYC